MKSARRGILRYLYQLTNDSMRKLTGLGLKRIPQWRRLVVEEGRTLGWPATLRSLAQAGLQTVLGGNVPGRVWKSRLRHGCGRCPVYDRARKACRDRAGMQLGCGCYMPLKAWMPRKACWIRGLRPNGKHGFAEAGRRA